jgi:hypothetical protein
MHLEYIIDTTGLIYLAVDITKSVAEIVNLLTHFDWYQRKCSWGTKREKDAADDALSKTFR